MRPGAFTGGRVCQSRHWDLAYSEIGGGLVAASSETDIWVAGGGQLAHWDGTTWSGGRYAGVRLLAVATVRPGEVAAGGEGGLLLRCTLAGCSDERLPGDVTALTATGPDDIWAGLSDGRLFHFDGATWSAAGNPAAGPVRQILALPGEVVIAAGDVVRGGPSRWVREHPVNYQARGVAGSGPDDVFVASDSEVAHWDGVRWSLWRHTRRDDLFMGLALRAPGQVRFFQWGGGYLGAGNTTSTCFAATGPVDCPSLGWLPRGSIAPLGDDAYVMSGSDDEYGVGALVAVERPHVAVSRPGERPRLRPHLTTDCATAGDSLWCIGDTYPRIGLEQTLWRHSGGVWERVLDLDPSRRHYGVFADEGGRVWTLSYSSFPTALSSIVGDGAGRVVPLLAPTGTVAGSYCVRRRIWGTGPEDLWVSDGPLALQHWNGRTFERVALPVPAEICAFAGDESTAFLATTTGLLRRVGDTWIATGLLWKPAESSVIVTAPGEAWVVAGGKVWHAKGAAWEPMTLPLRPLAVWKVGEEVWFTIGDARRNKGAYVRWDGTDFRIETLGDLAAAGFRGDTAGDVWAWLREHPHALLKRRP